MFALKKILIISAVFVFLLNGFSQVRLGIESGLNFSRAKINSMNGDENTGTRSGMLLGGFFEFNTSDHFSIQSGIRYIQRGSTSDNTVVKITQQVNYVEFPVTCNVIINFNKYKPFLAAGFYLSYHVFAKQKQSYMIGDYYEYDVGDFYKSSDIGYIIGGGLNYEISKTFDLFGAFYYSGGIKNVLEDGIQASAMNTGYQLSAGIKLRM